MIRESTVLRELLFRTWGVPILTSWLEAHCVIASKCSAFPPGFKQDGRISVISSNIPSIRQMMTGTWSSCFGNWFEQGYLKVLRQTKVFYQTLEMVQTWKRLPVHSDGPCWQQIHLRSGSGYTSLAWTEPKSSTMDYLCTKEKACKGYRLRY